MTSLQILAGRHLERTQDILKAAIHDNSSLDGGLLSLLEISEDIDLLKSKITSVSGLWNIIVKLVNATSTMDVVPVVYDVALRMKAEVHYALELCHWFILAEVASTVKELLQHTAIHDTDEMLLSSLQYLQRTMCFADGSTIDFLQSATNAMQIIYSTWQAYSVDPQCIQQLLYHIRMLEYLR